MLLAYALSPCDAQTPAVATITPKSCSFNAGLGSANTPVCQFSAITVPAGQAVTWALNGGPNAKMFMMSPSGQLSVGPADVPAAAAPYVVYVRGTAADGAAASISIKLIGDGIATITPKSCSFNAGPGSANTPVCQFSASTVPAGGAVAWTLNGGPNAKMFMMSPSGQLSVGPADVPAAAAPYVVYVRVGDGAFGKPPSLVDSPKPPQREGIIGFRCGSGIVAEPVGEIALARLVVELDGLLKMVMGAGKVAEVKAGGAGNAVRDQGLGAIGPGRGFAQEKLRHFAQRCRFAAVHMPHPNTVIGGEPFRGVFLPARQFAGAREGRARFRRLISLGPDQRIAEARL